MAEVIRPNAAHATLLIACGTICWTGSALIGIVKHRGRTTIFTSIVTKKYESRNASKAIVCRITNFTIINTSYAISFV